MRITIKCRQTVYYEQDINILDKEGEELLKLAEEPNKNEDAIADFIQNLGAIDYIQVLFSDKLTDFDIYQIPSENE